MRAKLLLLSLLAILANISINASEYMEPREYDFRVNGIYYLITSSTNNTVAVTYGGIERVYDEDQYADNEYHYGDWDDLDYYIIAPAYSGVVSIPSSVTCNGKSYQVTQIASHAFENCRGITAVNIPSSVTSIEERAFYKCSGLTRVRISRTTPPGIGSNTFEGLSNSAILYVPTGSKAVYEANNNWKNSFKEIEELISFTYSSTKTLCITNWDTNGDGELSVSEAEAVTSLGKVFKSNTTIISFNELQYFKGLTTLDDDFYGCTNLTSIIIPNTVTSIRSSTFYNCSSLTDVTIPNSVREISSQAFYGHTLNIRISDLEAWCNIAFLDGWANGFYLYLNGEKVSELLIPNTVTKIGNWTFQRCHLTSVEIPNSVTSIGIGAFKYCSLTSVSIPNSVTSIGKDVFYGCTNLEGVDIPNSVTTIGQGAFQGCENFTNVTIPNSVEIIGSYAFYGCRLMNINVGNSVTSIGDLAFVTGCTSDGLIMTVGMDTPVSVSEFCLPNNIRYGTLYVPAGSKGAYETADYWKNFGTIKEMADGITIGSAGMGTFCSSHPLDFSGTDDIKAYIVSAFKPSTGEVTLTRITDVPANTGIVVKGNADTYTIPWGPGETVVANMLVGVTENTMLNKVDGDYTNYILAKKNGSLGFYAVTDGSTLSAGKAYLPLPTAQLPSAARPMKMVFSDDEASGIEQTVSNGEQRGDYYDLQGRRVAKPAHGLYIVNGKKVIFK